MRTYVYYYCSNLCSERFSSSSANYPFKLAMRCMMTADNHHALHDDCGQKPAYPEVGPYLDLGRPRGLLPA